MDKSLNPRSTWMASLESQSSSGSLYEIHDSSSRPWSTTDFTFRVSYVIQSLSFVKKEQTVIYARWNLFGRFTIIPFVGINDVFEREKERREVAGWKMHPTWPNTSRRTFDVTTGEKLRQINGRVSFFLVGKAVVKFSRHFDKGITCANVLQESFPMLFLWKTDCIMKLRWAGLGWVEYVAISICSL